MSLYCDESGDFISCAEPLYAGTREDIPTYSALCRRIVDKIPQSLRLDQKATGTGVDIHKASSGATFTGAASYLGFQMGEFLFSISEETALRFIPNHYKKYPVTKG